MSVIYAPFEVVVHNKPDDCWLSFLGKVVDVTPLIAKYGDDRCVKPLIVFAGKDVSHWFDADTGEIQQCVHPITGLIVPYCPHGRIVGVPLTTSTPSEQSIPSLSDEDQWWKDPTYQIGVLTKSVRPIRIINMLILKEVTLNVCCEDTFEKIAERYSIFNKDPFSYTWRFLDTTIDMKKTMEENGIEDDRERFLESGLPKSFFTPSVFLYYNDDMKYYEDF